MGDSARSADDRLPWLDPPGPARPVSAARRARTPLLALLGLFCFGAIAVMAYLIGRGMEPRATIAAQEPVRAPLAVAAPAPAPVPAPSPMTPTATPPPALVTPPPVALAPPPAVVAPVRARPAEPRAARPKARRKASVSGPRPARSISRQRAVAVNRSGDRARAIAAVPPILRRSTPWPAQPFAAPRGRVIQLGTYTSPAQADAAWWRVARAYPYLTTLPRMVTWAGPSPGRPRTYRIRLAAGSRREARALCRNLHRIGRGCGVVR